MDDKIFEIMRGKSLDPKWKVFFDGYFCEHHGRDHAGTEIAVRKELQ